MYSWDGYKDLLDDTGCGGIRESRKSIILSLAAVAAGARGPVAVTGAGEPFSAILTRKNGRNRLARSLRVPLLSLC